MACISPLLIRKDGRRDLVPCGKCNFCLQSKRNDWSFRLRQEHKHSKTAYFLTLTYEDEKMPRKYIGDSETDFLGTLRKTDLQEFTKRLRRENALVCDWPLRYYSVGEYGTRTLRPHYHSIMFNLAPVLLGRLDAIWQNGGVHVGDVSPASIHYVTKYVINRTDDAFEKSGLDPPFALMSRRPGIGAVYISTHKSWHRADMRNYTEVNGIKQKIPRYLKEKIFSSLERKILSNAAIVEADVSYHDEVATLARFHADPYAYHDERVRSTHDRILNKVNTLNTF